MQDLCGDLEISGERFKELEKISSAIVYDCVKMTGDKHNLSITKIIKGFENREDLNLREKILCAFQVGMYTQRLFSPSSNEDE